MPMFVVLSIVIQINDLGNGSIISKVGKEQGTNVESRTSIWNIKCVSVHDSVVIYIIMRKLTRATILERR